MIAEQQRLREMHAAAERERQRQEEVLHREQERLEAERAVKAQQERARIEHEAELKRLADERVRQAKLEEERQELERLARQRLAQVTSIPLTLAPSCGIGDTSCLGTRTGADPPRTRGSSPRGRSVPGGICTTRTYAPTSFHATTTGKQTVTILTGASICLPVSRRNMRRKPWRRASKCKPSNTPGPRPCRRSPNRRLP